MSHQTGRDVVTYVIYSGNIKNPSNNLQTGINEYKVNSISMANKDGDKIYNDIVEKISTIDKILKAINIVKDIDNKYRLDVESILYAFANKFLTGKDLERVKEELRMTELGKSLIQEGLDKGIKQGIEKGKEEGKAELLIKQLMKKFKKVPEEYKEKIKTLPKETIELIAMDIFDLNSIDELEQYF